MMFIPTRFPVFMDPTSSPLFSSKENMDAIIQANTIAINYIAAMFLSLFALYLAYEIYTRVVILIQTLRETENQPEPLMFQNPPSADFNLE